jgi:hypothetical protein
MTLSNGPQEISIPIISNTASWAWPMDLRNDYLGTAVVLLANVCSSGKAELASPILAVPSTMS